jgi:hypothetical protein
MRPATPGSAGTAGSAVPAGGGPFDSLRSLRAGQAPPLTPFGGGRPLFVAARNRAILAAASARLQGPPSGRRWPSPHERPPKGCIARTLPLCLRSAMGRSWHQRRGHRPLERAWAGPSRPGSSSARRRRAGGRTTGGGLRGRADISRPGRRLARVSATDRRRRRRHPRKRPERGFSSPGPDPQRRAKLHAGQERE